MSCTDCQVLIDYGIYKSVSPSLFRRGPRRSSSLGDDPATNSTPITRITLTGVLGRGAMGMVHSAILNIGQYDGSHLDLEVVVKMVFDEEFQHQLAHEESIYNHLHEYGLRDQPTLFGHFHDTDDRGPSCLILSSVGAQLRQCGPINRSLRSVFRPMVDHISTNKANRDKYLDILSMIHKAGILHGDIRHQNLMLDNQGRPHIIDFNLSMKCDEKSAFEEELKELADLLGNLPLQPPLSGYSDIDPPISSPRRSKRLAAKKGATTSTSSLKQPSDRSRRRGRKPSRAVDPGNCLPPRVLSRKGPITGTGMKLRPRKR